MRSTCCGLIGCLLLSLAPAQQTRPSWPEIQKQLRASDPATVAWGARHAAQAGLAQAGPELGRILARPGPDWESPESRAVLESVLDAMVQTHARIPEDVLRPWAQTPRLQVPIVVAAVRAPRDFRRLIADWFADRSQPQVWAIACALRAQEEPRELAAELLHDLAIRVRVTVRGPLATPGVCGGLVMLPARELPDLTPPEGFPPVVAYRIAECGRAVEPGVSVLPLCERPKPFRAERMEAPAWSFLADLPWQGVDCTQYGLDTLQSLTEARDWLQAFHAVSHHWESADRYRTKVGAEVTAFRDRWRGLLEELVRRKLVEPRLAKDAQPRFEVEVVDERSDKGVALPELK